MLLPSESSFWGQVEGGRYQAVHGLPRGGLTDILTRAPRPYETHNKSAFMTPLKLLLFLWRHHKHVDERWTCELYLLFRTEHSKALRRELTNTESTHAETTATVSVQSGSAAQAALEKIARLDTLDTLTVGIKTGNKLVNEVKLQLRHFSHSLKVLSYFALSHTHEETGKIPRVIRKNGELPEDLRCFLPNLTKLSIRNSHMH